MNHVLHCSCGEVIVKSLAHDTKIRAKVLVIRDNVSYAVCKSCDREVQVPLQLDVDMLKSLSAEKPKHVPLYIRNVYRNPESS